MTTSSSTAEERKSSFRVRTVTCFVHLFEADFGVNDDAASTTTTTTTVVDDVISKAAKICNDVKEKMTANGYTVQSIRIATNPFPEWLIMQQNDASLDAKKKEMMRRLGMLEATLIKNDIRFFSLGCAQTLEELKEYVVPIVKYSTRMSCSANLSNPTDVDFANEAARCVVDIATLSEDGFANFRFCVASSCADHIPFFPAAKASSSAASVVDGNSTSPETRPYKFAVGLENGALAQLLLKESKSIKNIPTIFRKAMAETLLPIQQLCADFVKNQNVVVPEGDLDYLGIDTSLNPNVARSASVALALEQLDEVSQLGHTGTIAAVAAVTHALQSLDTEFGLKTCGYRGVMLPLCEDARLAELGNLGTNKAIRITDFLQSSAVCGVGVDTVPVPGNCNQAHLAALFLDMAGIAHRWQKSLSVRAFPIPGKTAGEMTTFTSPFLINTKVLSLDPAGGDDV